MDEKIKTKISISNLKADFDRDKTANSNLSLENWIGEKKETLQNSEQEQTIENENLIPNSWEWENSAQNETTKEEIKEQNSTETEKKTISNELFTNYVPLSEKRRLSFLEKLEHLKNKAKTNYIFILITVIVWWIFSCLIIFISPQYHSFTNYKANVINIISKINWKEVPQVKNIDWNQDKITKKENNINDLKQISETENFQSWTIIQETNIDEINKISEINNFQSWAIIQENKWWISQEEKVKIEIKKMWREKIKEYFKNH